MDTCKTVVCHSSTRSNCNRNLQTSKAPLESQAQGTSLFAGTINKNKYKQMSRIDYCNVAFAGLPQRSIIRLQAVINAAARLILRVKKFDHISTLLRDELQWLRIGER